MIGNNYSYKPVAEYASSRQGYQVNSPYSNGRMTQTTATDRLYKGDSTGDYDAEKRISNDLASLFANIKTINLN